MPPILNQDLHPGQASVAYPQVLDGMRSPRVVLLGLGLIYKFTSSVDPSTGERRALDRQAFSPWWFDERQFAKVRGHLGKDPGNQGFIARSQAAVLYGWSHMDTLIVAKVIQPMKVFVGVGEWQWEVTGAGSSITYQAPDDLLQMYVPNVDRVSGRTIYVDGWPAIHIVSSQRITSGDAIDRLIQTLPGKNIVLPGTPTVH